MFKLVAPLFSCAFFAVMAEGYQITSPSDLGTGQPWTAMGPNNIVWQHVDTDPSTFAIVLVNEDRSVLPVNDQLLASNVDGTLLSLAISPPSGSSFPTGSGFRVNFIQDANDPSTIYAQSSQFNIGTSGSTSAGTSSGSTAITTTMMTGTNSAGGTPTTHVTYTNSSDTQTVTVTRNAAKTLTDIPPSVVCVLFSVMTAFILDVYA